jgi:rSAM/selenodomain-associated transferase 1
MMTMQQVVYVVAKAPSAGVSKTRLCPPLQPGQAAELALAFLGDTLTSVDRVGCTARVMCRDTAEQAALQRSVGVTTRVSVQGGRGLGDALESAFREGLGDGFAAVAVLGADSPTLPSSILRGALRALTGGADAVLGPTEDGGYYLMAARRLHPALFRDMPWSTNRVAAVTLDRCRQAGLRTHLLPCWYDVDDAPALTRLRAELAQARASLAPRTRSALDAYLAANGAPASDRRRCPPGVVA